jgi:ubiquinone/menaquinone biosynthesis C-methylase UbiE
MTTPESSVAGPGLAQFYRQFFEDPAFDTFYGGSGWANFGWWQDTTVDAATASEALARQVMKGVPKKHRARGRILDVACGQGASTHWLARRRPLRRIVAIGNDESQLRAARLRVPGGRIERMDATALQFDDATFRTVLCIEAAFHFETRARFLAEALRVLKPGGWLVMSDLLMARGALLTPAANYLAGPAPYARLLETTGFERVTVADITHITWHRYRQALNRFLSERLTRTADPRALASLATLNLMSTWSVRRCVQIAARKPR